MAEIASAIAEPARTRMLCALLDGRAKTSTELATIAEIGASTASVHLNKLLRQGLVQVLAQGKHRYYQLGNPMVASALESLLVLIKLPVFTPSTPDRLRLARTCYDHLAGTIAVQLYDRLLEKAWVIADTDQENCWILSQEGQKNLLRMGLDLASLEKSRRRFACSCLDWSERRMHLAGALGAALLRYFLQNGWLDKELDSRALILTPKGILAFKRQFAITMNET